MNVSQRDTDARAFHEMIWGEESARMYWDASLQDFCKWIKDRADRRLRAVPEDPSEVSDKEALQYSKIGLILATPAYRTEPIVARLIQAALIPQPTQRIATLRARKLIMGIAMHGEKAVPANEMDLVSWSELSKSEEKFGIDPEDAMAVDAMAAVTITGSTGSSQRVPRRVPRSFKNCMGCNRRFLAKRANNMTCSTRCRQRALRKTLRTARRG
jgi:hypothetical protein